MRLLQLNLWEGRLIRHIPDYIKGVDPDLVCLQEVYSCETEVPKPSRMFNSLQQIQAVCGYQYAYMSPTFSTVYSGAKVDYGNAILSRYPLTDTQTIFVSGEYNPEFTAQDSDDHIKNLQIVRLQLPTTSMVLANHHGCHGPDAFGDKATVQKMKLIKEQLAKQPAPLIFAGDLNVTTDTETMAVLDGFLEDLAQTRGITSTLSSLAKPLFSSNGTKLKAVACDHVLISREVQAKSFEADETLVSDHKPLVLEFEI